MPINNHKTPHHPYRRIVRKNNALLFTLALVLLLTLVPACAKGESPAAVTTTAVSTVAAKSRVEAIPAGKEKMSPGADRLPPILHSAEFEQPVPLGAGVNTAGAEDSAFVMPDGNTLYFFFTPDGTIPAEKQLFDGVTGIWVSKRVDGVWQEATRVVLEAPDELALDGAACVQGDRIWFCSARQGNYRGVDMWTAEYQNGAWGKPEILSKQLNVDFEMGEVHVAASGSEIYFHSARVGGEGGVDIWLTRKVGGEWQMPENVAAVNLPDIDGWPFLTQDGNELWFTRIYQGSPAVFRSKKVDGQWSEPELIVSQFAGEPSVDNEGNLYFTHHFYWDGKMLEADIYVAKKSEVSSNK